MPQHEPEMTANDVLGILQLFDENGITIIIDCGGAVDAFITTFHLSGSSILTECSSASLMLLFFLAILLTYFLVILREERSLRQKYGEIFEDYCARVPRYI